MNQSSPRLVYIGGLVHEANAFSPVPTPLRDFRRYRPETPLSAASADATAVIDFVQAVQATGDRAIRGEFAIAEPSAPANAADYAILRDALLADLARHQQISAVLLFLHGAQTATSEADCAGDIVQRVRAQQGDHCRIGVVLDLHANVTPRLLQAATVVACCKHYPHTDQGAIAQQLWQQLSTHWQREFVAHWLPIPCFPAATTTTRPMAELVTALVALESNEDVLIASAAHGFPQADVTHGTAGVLVYEIRDAALSGAAARTDLPARIRALAQHFFELAVQAIALDPPYAIGAALDRAGAANGRVLIAERSDNPGAGGSADITGLLHELAADPRFTSRRIGCALLYDPAAVTAAMMAGPGQQIPGPIAGKLATSFGTPLPGPFDVCATIDNLTQPLFGSGGSVALGPSVLLRRRNLWLVVTSTRQQPFSPVVFQALGCDPQSLDVIVVKSTNHFFDQFAPIVDTIIYCDAPGPATEDLAALDYQQLPRPLFPLDEPSVCRQLLQALPIRSFPAAP